MGSIKKCNQLGFAAQADSKKQALMDGSQEARMEIRVVEGKTGSSEAMKEGREAKKIDERKKGMEYEGKEKSKLQGASSRTLERK